MHIVTNYQRSSDQESVVVDECGSQAQADAGVDDGLETVFNILVVLLLICIFIVVFGIFLDVNWYWKLVCDIFETLAYFEWNFSNEVK